MHALSSEIFHQCFVKAHKVVWFEKHHISTFWLSNMHFPKPIIFMHADTSKERLEETTLLIPPLFYLSSGPQSTTPNATSLSDSTARTSTICYVIISRAVPLHLEAPDQGTAPGVVV